MFGRFFYNRTIETVTHAFERLFAEIKVKKTGTNKETIVPIVYSQTDKFIRRIREYNDLNESAKIEHKLPRIGIEFTGLQYDSSEAGNIQRTVCTVDGFTLAPVPYVLNYKLLVATKTVEEMDQIIGYILWYFRPTLTVQVYTNKEKNIYMNLPFTLENTDINWDYEGNLADKTTYISTFTFSVKTMFYGDLTLPAPTVIRKVIIDYDKFQESTYALNPIDAEPTDDYVIDYTVKLKSEIDDE